ncbi:MAG TPA: hypothetical protein VG186_07090 [Solirubrobacteraceae bacterium]|nr:hypothetical protein [Solirubrobacteraceae bacterium]
MLASVALIAVIAVIAVIALGASGNAGVDPVAQAATVSSSAPGYRMHMAMQISGLPTAITATGDGTFDVPNHSGTMTLAMNFGNDPQIVQSLGSNTLRIEEIVNGTTVYMKLPATLTSGLRLLGKQWIAVNLAKATGIPGLSSLQSNPVSSDPSEMLQYLRAQSDSIVNAGHEVLDGLPTTHYRAQLSLDRVAAAVPAADRPAAQQALSQLEQVTQIHTLPVDVWVDADHRVRRIETTVSPSLPGGQTLNESITIDISHYGPEPQPAIPPAGEVANVGG